MATKMRESKRSVLAARFLRVARADKKDRQKAQIPYVQCLTIPKDGHTVISLLDLPPELLIQILHLACTTGNDRECLRTAHALAATCRHTHAYGQSILYSSVAIYHPNQFFALASRQSSADSREPITNIALHESTFSSLQGKPYKRQSDFDLRVFSLKRMKSWMGESRLRYTLTCASTIMLLPGCLGLIPIAIPTCFILFMLDNERLSDKVQVAVAYELSVLVHGVLLSYDAAMIGVRSIRKFARILQECSPRKSHRNVIRNMFNYKLLRKPKLWPVLADLTVFSCANPSSSLIRNLTKIAPQLRTCTFEDFRRSTLTAMAEFLRKATTLRTLIIKAAVEPSPFGHPPAQIDITELHLDESLSLYRFECANILIFAFASMASTSIKELCMTHYMACDELYLWQTRLSGFIQDGVFDNLDELTLDPDEFWPLAGSSPNVAELGKELEKRGVRLETDAKYTRHLLSASVSSWDADQGFFLF